MQDNNGNVLALFSKFIGIADSNFAELIAVQKALSMFDLSSLKGQSNLIIERDSGDAVSWSTKVITKSDKLD